MATTAGPPRAAIANAQTHLFRGDALDLLAELPSGSVDAVWTDPPYFLSSGGLGFSHGRMAPTYKGAWDEPKGPRASRSFHRAWVKEAARALKEGRSFWVTASHHGLEHQLAAISDAGLRLRQVLIWQKTDPPPTISLHYFPFEMELLIWATKGNISWPRTPARMRRDQSSWAQHSVWKMPAVPMAEKTYGRHPTQKPLQLVSRCLSTTTTTGDLVLDPFVGSGTTCVAAAGNRCRSIGIDLNSGFLEIAKKRLESIGARVALHAWGESYELKPS